MSATQKRIDELVGLSYESFINICIFTDDQRSCFLECDKNTKREIVENLLSLGPYREWFENAKLAKKETKNKIESETKEFSLFLNNKEEAEQRLKLTEDKNEQWFKQKTQEIKLLEDKIEQKKLELQKSDSGAALILFQEAQERISKINEEIPEIEKSKKDLQEKIILIEQKENEQRENAQIFSEKFKDFSRETKYKIEEKNKLEREVEELEKEVPGTRCGKCKSVVESKNIEEYKKKIKKDVQKIEEFLELIDVLIGVQSLLVEFAAKITIKKSKMPNLPLPVSTSLRPSKLQARLMAAMRKSFSICCLKSSNEMDAFVSGCCFMRNRQF
jgi:DNA repair exonuclease SbcCD ATPase subunit